MGSERAEFQASIDLRQVNTELSTVRSRLNEAIGPGSKLEGGLDKIDRAGREAGKGLGAMQFALGAAGPGAREFSNVVGDLAGLLGGGGAFAIGLAGASFAIAKIAETYKDAKQGTEAFKQSTSTTAEFIRTRGVDSIAKYREEIDKLEKAVRDYGKTQREIMIDDLETQVEGLRASKITLEANLPALRERAKAAAEEAAALRGDAYQENAQITGQILSNAEARAKALEAQLPALQAQLDRLYGLDARGDGATTGKTGGGGGGGRAANDNDELDLETKRQLWLTKMREEAVKHRLDNDAKARAATQKAEEEHQAFLTKMMEDAERERTKVEEEQARERKRIAEDEQKAKIAEAEAIGGALASVGIATAKAFASGTDVASMFGNMLTEVARQVGEFTILQGGQVLAAGIAELVLSNGTSPTGYAKVAGGAGLVAVGTAITTGGAAAVQGLLGQASGAGGARAAAATTDRGTDGGRRGGGGGGSSQNVVNITYGLGGPPPEDTARSVVEAIRVADRRRFR